MTEAFVAVATNCMRSSTQLFGLGVVERSRLWLGLATLLGVRMLMGRIARPWPWLAGDDLSDAHHRHLPGLPGAVALLLQAAMKDVSSNRQ